MMMMMMRIKTKITIESIHKTTLNENLAYLLKEKPKNAYITGVKQRHTENYASD